MKILITTHQLANFAGSELYTFALAKGLRNAGHQVTVYSRYVDAFVPLFELEGITLVTNLETLKKQKFDVAHVQHNINALEVRQIFPNLPIFFLSHSVTAFLESVPAIDINIALYGAVSEKIRRSLKTQGVLLKNIELVNNLIDEDNFKKTSNINLPPKKALIISNRIDSKTEENIDNACKELGITVTKVGSRFKSVPNDQIPQLINNVDIVFSLGRGVMEAMMCGRVPFILDFKGGDGIVTPQNYKKLESCHFNGTVLKKKFTADQIVKELLTNYDLESAKKINQRTIQNYSIREGIKKLEKVYQKTINLHKNKNIDQKLLDYIVESIHVTRLHTFSRSEFKNRQQFISDSKVKIKRKIKNFSIKSNFFNPQTVFSNLR